MAGERQCGRCGACCRYVTAQLDDPKSKRDWSIFFWYLLHENVNIYIDEDGDWFLEFKTKCTALDDGKCSIHRKRPAVCREHDPEDCESSSPEPPYIEMFHVPEELEEWLEKEGIEFRYKRGGY